MTYSTTLVGNTILARSFSEQCPLTPMKLQKVLFFVASEYQKKTGEPLFNEPFETWTYGPVLRSIFDEFRVFSKSNITRYARDAMGKYWVVDENQYPVLREVINSVWQATKNLSATELSRITHYQDSAWDKAFQSDNPVLDGTDIAHDSTYRQRLGLA